MVTRTARNHARSRATKLAWARVKPAPRQRIRPWSPFGANHWTSFTGSRLSDRIRPIVLPQHHHGMPPAVVRQWNRRVLDDLPVHRYAADAAFHARVSSRL